MKFSDKKEIAHDDIENLNQKLLMAETDPNFADQSDIFRRQIKYSQDIIKMCVNRLI